MAHTRTCAPSIPSSPDFRPSFPREGSEGSLVVAAWSVHIHPAYSDSRVRLDISQFGLEERKTYGWNRGIYIYIGPWLEQWQADDVGSSSCFNSSPLLSLKVVVMDIVSCDGLCSPLLILMLIIPVVTV